MSSASAATSYSALSLKDIVCLCAEPYEAEPGKAEPCNEEAWQEFIARVGRPISLSVMRTASLWGVTSASLVQDLVQITYLKLWENGCCLLRDFAVQHPEHILGYLKKIAINATHDHFKHRQSQTSGGDTLHVSTSDIEPQMGKDAQGSEERIAFTVFLDEIDELLKRSLTRPDQERDRTIFWLYFRQGLSTKEIASLPGMGLGTKGVGSVIERLKQCIREQIAGTTTQAPEPEPEYTEKEISPRVRMGLYEAPVGSTYQ
jgi:RNA polymerase sigma-70 factor, ECF subfamily